MSIDPYSPGDTPWSTYRLASIAYKAYIEGRKAPRTRKAGAGYKNPDYELSLSWLEAKAAIDAAQVEFEEATKPRVLLINGSARNQGTCPGEISKSSRLIALKLMIDRLVCADGGNADPTSTEGKKAEKAKALELNGWDYPRHLKGRIFSVVVHGDVEGADRLKSSLVDWFQAMEMIPAAPMHALARYIGYFEPYASSHEALDKDKDLQKELENTAEALLQSVHALKRRELDLWKLELDNPRPK